MTKQKQPKLQLPETLTREFIQMNRQKWIDFLKKPGRKKATGVMDEREGARCCLGHACYVLRDYMRVKTEADRIYYEYNGGTMNNVGKELLGLKTSHGNTSGGHLIQPWGRSSLAAINDQTSATPKEIGEYLQTVIEGGPKTPFKPLSDYPTAAEVAARETEEAA